MIRSQIVVTDGLNGVSARIRQLARQAANDAARVAQETAQAAASIDLQLELIPAHPDQGAFAAGIRSHKTGRASSVEIATFFDRGTLGGHKGALKGNRRESWTVKRSTGSYTARRRTVGGGIPAERFFLKARLAGRRTMLQTVKRTL